MGISAQDVKALRERSGAGMMECKRALEESRGDMNRAVDILRERGLAAAAKKAGRSTSEGLVESYVHAGGRIGVLLEINCETDFVAKTEDFKTLAHDIALHVAASRPLYVSRSDVPPSHIDREKDVLRRQALNEKKPEAIIEKMVQGRIDKFYKEICLMEQPFVKNPDVSIEDLIKENIARLGEQIQIRRFARFERGEDVAVENT